MKPIAAVLSLILGMTMVASFSAWADDAMPVGEAGGVVVNEDPQPIGPPDRQPRDREPRDREPNPVIGPPDQARELGVAVEAAGVIGPPDREPRDREPRDREPNPIIGPPDHELFGLREGLDQFMVLNNEGKGVDHAEVSAEGLKDRIEEFGQRAHRAVEKLRDRLKEAWEHVRDDPAKRAEFVAKANALLDEAQVRVNEASAKLKAKIEAIPGHDEQKAKALEAVDRIVTKVSGAIADAKDRINQAGQSGELNIERTEPIGPPDVEPVDRKEPEPIGPPDRQPGDREPQPIGPPDRDHGGDWGDGKLPPKYLEDAAARLDEMEARVTAKAAETRQRIESSNLNPTEKTRLLEKIDRAKQYALARIDGLRDKLSAPADGSVDVAAASDQHRDQDGEQHRADEQSVGVAPITQSKEQQNTIMKQVEEKRKAEENGPLVPGTGGEPLQGRFEREGGAPPTK